MSGKLAFLRGTDGRLRLRVPHRASLAKVQLLHEKIIGPPADDEHQLISALLRYSVHVAAGVVAVTPEFQTALAKHVNYHQDILDRYSDTNLDDAGSGFVPYGGDRDAPDAILQSVAELLEHLGAGYGMVLALAAMPDFSAQDESDPLYPLLPRSVFALRTEAALDIVSPWFLKSLEIPGDVCEVGCYQGTMAIKFAFVVRARGLPKKVYAFDTFEGFHTSDPAGGSIGVGYYGVNNDAYQELLRWSDVIPVIPVKGDATETTKIVHAPLSFIWMDLDHGSLMRPAFENLWPWITPQTIIGVDDVGHLDGAGRQVTPGVEPWLDELIAAGRLTEIERHPGAYIRFYRADKSHARLGSR
jgi:Methyltransferase domain